MTNGDELAEEVCICSCKSCSSILVCTFVDPVARMAGKFKYSGIAINSMLCMCVFVCVCAYQAASEVQSAARPFASSGGLKNGAIGTRLMKRG